MPADPVQAIGIFGGTFDPVHLGHLRAALEVREALALTQVRFVPSGVPPHRAAPHASTRQRLAMLRAAIAGEPAFRLDDREVRRPGPSFMVDTLTTLRAEVGHTPLCLILGMDAFLGLPTWHRWEGLSELAHLVVMHRPGWEWREEQAPFELARQVTQRRTDRPRRLHGGPAGHIMFVPVTPLDISATRIRAASAQGLSARYLVPEPVWELIQTQQIYG